MKSLKNQGHFVNQSLLQRSKRIFVESRSHNHHTQIWSRVAFFCFRNSNGVQFNCSYQIEGSARKMGLIVFFLGMRFNSVMVVEQSRGQQPSAQFQPIAVSQAAPEHPVLMEASQHQQSQQQISQTQNKITSSPRPSILRKRDHEGSPLKAAKNLTPVLQGSNQPPPSQSLPSPPSPPRPDSRGNGHSSGMFDLKQLREVVTYFFHLNRW